MTYNVVMGTLNSTYSLIPCILSTLQSFTGCMYFLLPMQKCQSTV